MKYLVSVVVATKNRYQYLKHLIQLIDSFKLSELEFIIQDNSDDNIEILNFLNNFNNPNIKYYHSSDKLTMSQNGELAIKKAQGEFVCYIGDDDGVCRNIVDCVKWMKKIGIDAAYNKNVWFMWGQSAKFLWRKYAYTLHNTRDELESLVKKGCNLSETNIPLLYHGIVRKSILDDIICRYGTLFPSVPPDIAGSILLAKSIDKCCELKTPVIINGISNMSGGGVVSKGGVLSLSEVSFVSQEEINRWEVRIPPIWCGHYAWANSGIKALNVVGLYSLSDSVDIDYCLSKATSLRPNKIILWKHGFKFARNKAKYVFLIVIFFVLKYMKKIIGNLPGLLKEQKGVQNIVEAEKFFFNYSKTF